MSGFGGGLSPEEMEQLRERLGQLAAVMADYVDRLQAAGFSREEALTIAIAERAANLQAPS